MDVVQMTLMRRIYMEQSLNRARLLDLAGDHSQVVALSCARNPALLIILILLMAIVRNWIHHKSPIAFIPLSLCSLSALFLLYFCLFPALSAPSHCQVRQTAFLH